MTSKGYAMKGPARAGAVIFAKDLARVTEFYCQVMGMARQMQDAEHAVIASADLQLVVHAIPEAIAADLVIMSPPPLRTQAAIKLFFTVPSLEQAAAEAQALGGALHGYRWNGPGFVACDGHDCEGNVFQLRELTGDPWVA
jgi:predicted enzyme related to lactoylglutathione lyase